MNTTQTTRTTATDNEYRIHTLQVVIKTMGDKLQQLEQRLLKLEGD